MIKDIKYEDIYDNCKNKMKSKKTLMLSFIGVLVLFLIGSFFTEPFNIIYPIVIVILIIVLIVS